jgi:hypothetical protein
MDRSDHLHPSRSDQKSPPKDQFFRIKGPPVRRSLHGARLEGWPKLYVWVPNSTLQPYDGLFYAQLEKEITQIKK